MKSKSLILMFVSLGFGLVAAIGISQVMGRSKGSGGNVRTSPVVIAMDFIDINTLLTEEIVKIEEWPANIVPENAVHSMEELQNMAAAHSIQKGAPIFTTDIVNKDVSSDIALKDNQRLYSLKVGPEQIQNGIMNPGDFVDIIATIKMGSGSSQKIYSATILKKIQVYSVNDAVNRQSGPREAGDVKQNSIIGLVVNEKQAEKIAIVQSAGTLSFVMRGKSSVGPNEPDEEVEPLPSWLTGDEIKKPVPTGPSLSDTMKSLAASSAAHSKPKRSIVVWHGSERSVSYLNDDGSIAEPVKPNPPNQYPALQNSGLDLGSQPSGGSDQGSQPNREPDEYVDR